MTAKTFKLTPPSGFELKYSNPIPPGQGRLKLGFCPKWDVSLFTCPSDNKPHDALSVLMTWKYRIVMRT
jgi:hypothetical protein